MFANDAQALYRLAHAGTGLAIVPEFLVAVDITKKHGNDVARLGVAVDCRLC